MKTYTHKGRQIDVNECFPPVPSRDYDWIAVLEEQHGDEWKLQGFGATPDAAAADLIEQLEADDEDDDMKLWDNTLLDGLDDL